MNAMPQFTTNEVHRFKGLEVEIILASTCENGAPVYTIRMRYPRIIHSEVMTHRVFNRNARSSRAVPVMTMLAELRNGGMFTPWHWGKNQSGMQASEENNTAVSIDDVKFDGSGLAYCNVDMSREDAWKIAGDQACDYAESFHYAGYHKQVVNRLIEPFSYIDVLITATDWANFLHLRDHGDAEPHLRDLARLVKKAMAAAKFQHLEYGDWHLPYITADDYREVEKTFAYANGSPVDLENRLELLKKISAARCARISYKPFDGNPSYEREVERYESLVGSGAVHATPLEHQATPDSMSHYETFKSMLMPDGTVQVKPFDGGFDWDHKNLHGSLRGWIQFRKTVPNECVYDT